MTSARDIRDAEQLARQNALNLEHNAPPPAADYAAWRHNMRLAQCWRRIAECHDEYAVEIEQQVAS